MFAANTYKGIQSWQSTLRQTALSPTIYWALTKRNKTEKWLGDETSEYSEYLFYLRTKEMLSNGWLTFWEIFRPTQKETREYFKNQLDALNNKIVKKRVERFVNSFEKETNVNHYSPGMVFVKGGTFRMGSNEDNDEKPSHTVTVDDFYIGKYEVTFEEYDKFCEATGKHKPNDQGWGRGKRPVINVSWNDAVAYCNWLSEKEGLEKFYNINGRNVTMNWNANGYRLPTEAEWGYAARGGNKTHGYKFAGTNDKEELYKYCNYADKNTDYSWSDKRHNDGYIYTSPVGIYSPNELYIYDMSGNVWEWCNDWYSSNYYKNSPRNNPKGPSSGSRRVARGGSWDDVPYVCRVAVRNYGVDPSVSDDGLGFRIARTP